LLRKLAAMSLNVSAFTQLQNWFTGQAAVNKQIFGNTDATPTTDFGAAFANAENNFFSQKNSLAVTAMQLRQVQSAQQSAQSAKPASGANTKTTSGSTATTTAKPAAAKTGTDPALTAAKAAGNDILTSLGLISSPPQKATPSSTSGPYKPPTNAATGYAYVPTSAASAGDLGAANLLSGTVNLFA
jgi:hypothetical protein